MHARRLHCFEDDRLASVGVDTLVDRMAQELGFRLGALPEDMIRHRLSARARGLRIPLNEYLDLVSRPDGFASERLHLIDSLTTNTTSFFRERRHYELLAGPILRSLNASGEPRRLKLWSAASSNGAEAFSAAMVLEASKRSSGRDYAVLGTDIAPAMVASAAQAIYPAEAMAGVPPAFQERFLMRSKDVAAQKVRIVPEIRRRVRFQGMNLMQDAYPVDSDVDVVMLRNVLIYFDAGTRRSVVSRVCEHIRPGGFLVLGHSEASASPASGFKQVDASVYQRD